MPEHRRRSIRLKGYDYAQPGAYFITICMQHRMCALGEIHDAQLVPSPAGSLVERKWMDVPRRFPNVELGPFVIMPNHLHGIILINGVQPDVSRAEVKPVSIGSIIQWFKTGTTYDYITGVKRESWPSFDKQLWQRNYWGHVIRNDADYERIAQYIDRNPSSWNEDSLHPSQPEWPQKGQPSRRRPSEE